ncbi:hypothetical protein QWZ13_09935 [Reinekea marina]|uniref:Protein FliT n=1 Tax=Reinekea marina TaxID=1310421 RepID=A0ABV7WS84_9GAMM|nr:hypothetical protein [Reinekea marina]MDN3649231.1 hypothetical protein [Reinekea marina]
MPTLKQLDTAFNDLWLNTEQLPTLLDKWQEMVSEHLSTLGDNKEDLDAFEERMIFWHAVLEENRSLIQAHQATLKETIKTGEPSPKKDEQTRAYRKN